MNKFLSKKKLCAILACCCFIQQPVMAQTAEEIQKVFPGYDFVYLNYNRELIISKKDGVPVAESKYDIDMMMLTDKNVNMFSRYTVYHSGFNELRNLEAYTKVPNGGSRYKTVKVSDQKTTSSRQNSIFYDDSKETSFDFPALSQYAIAHLDYSLYHKDAHLLSPYYCPGYIPVMNSTYTVTVPNDITIKYLVKNDPGGSFEFSEEKKKKETIYRWTTKNVKSKDSYSNSPSLSYYQPHVIIYIASYETKDGRQQFLENVDDLYKWNFAFTKELNTSEDAHLKKTVDSLVGKEKDERVKAKKIYKWVQENIKYIAFEDGLEGFRPRQAADVYSKRYGDCKDMSSIITQMLRMAGISAYYTWIGTRDLPYKYSEIPLPIVDNHMICTAKINGEWIFLDGTNPHARFGLPPAFIQGKEALVGINASEYKILTVPVAKEETNTIHDSTFISFTSNGIRGNEKINYTGYFGEGVYNSLLYRDEKETKDYVTRKMGKGSNKFILGKYSIDKLKPEDNLVNISADFEIPGYSKQVGNEYYINLNLGKIYENMVIDTAKRKVPWEEDYKYDIRQYHILDIPADYKVSYMPKNFSMENDVLKVNMYYKMEGNKIIAAQEIQNKKLLISVSDFEHWNNIVKPVQAQYKEAVVLEKN